LREYAVEGNTEYDEVLSVFAVFDGNKNEFIKVFEQLF